MLEVHQDSIEKQQLWQYITTSYAQMHITSKKFGSTSILVSFKLFFAVQTPHTLGLIPMTMSMEHFIKRQLEKTELSFSQLLPLIIHLNAFINEKKSDHHFDKEQNSLSNTGKPSTQNQRLLLLA